MHVQDTDHSAFITNTYSYKSHYITRSEILNFCTSNVCTFGSYIMFDIINNIPRFPVSVSRFRGFAKSFVSLFHSAQKVNVSISGLNIFPNEYSGWYENSKGHAFCSSRIDVHFAETRTPYSPNEGILFTCHDWGLLSAYGICQLFLAYQRKTSLLNQVFMPPHQII